MNVVIRWSRVATKCNYCSEPIIKDTPLLVWWVKWGRWGKRFYFHPECWIKDRVWHLGNIPFPIDSRGRPRITLNEGDRKSRKKLINQHNRLSKLTGQENYHKMVKIEKKLENLGGIPKSWGQNV